MDARHGYDTPRDPITVIDFHIVFDRLASTRTPAMFRVDRTSFCSIGTTSYSQLLICVAESRRPRAIPPSMVCRILLHKW